MRNGDSFHNGSENLELQQRIRENAGLAPLQTDASGSTTEKNTSLDNGASPAECVTADTAPSADAPASDSAGFVGTKEPKNIYARPAKNISAPGAAGTPSAGTTVPNSYADPRVEDHTPPHKRPYVSIYAREGGVTYTAGAEKPSETSARAAAVPPAERDYVNIYAQRAAQRTEPTERSVYSNTPDMTDGIPYYGDSEASLAKRNAKLTYGTPAAAYAPECYSTEDFPDETAERAHKGKLNMAALILGIVSFAGNMVCLTCLTPITAILAIIFGCIGRVNGKFEQKGLIGMVLGIVYCGLILLMLLFLFLVGLMTAEETGGAV